MKDALLNKGDRKKETESNVRYGKNREKRKEQKIMIRFKKVAGQESRNVANENMNDSMNERWKKGVKEGKRKQERKC